MSYVLLHMLSIAFEGECSVGGHHISMQKWILFIGENHEQDPYVMLVNYRQLAGHRRPQVVGHMPRRM